MVAELPADVRGARDRAILLLGFATGCRRSEMVDLDAADLTFTSQGAIVALKRSKTDQPGEGRKLGVPHGRPGTCPVAAIRAWLEASQIVEGPLFRGVDKAGRISAERLTAQMIRAVVIRTAKTAGIDPKNLGAHSLRAGLVTAALIGGATEISVMRQTGHRSVNMLRRYARDADLFRGNAADALGL